MKRALIFCVPTLLLVVASCGGKGSVGAESGASGGDTLRMEYARNLTLVSHPGYTEAILRNPWDTTRTLRRYLLVADSLPVPEGLPEGTLVRTPLRRAVVYSSVHTGLLTELGAADIIGGVCDASYIRTPEIKARIEAGAIADCGSNQAPNIERIISINPDALLLSPYENSGDYGKATRVGVPIVECADYMEASPLGRAEWVKLYGLLAGKEAEADSIWRSTRDEYLKIKALTARVEYRPRVLTDKLYGAAWYVPGARSTTTIYISDAGGKNPFDYIDESGSRPLSAEQVLMKGGDADIWLVRYHQSKDKTLAELGADDAIYSRFAPYRNGRVYGCNTARVNFYEETPFHPQWYLSNLVGILHPELAAQLPPQKVYYTKMR